MDEYMVSLGIKVAKVRIKKDKGQDTFTVTIPSSVMGKNKELQAFVGALEAAWNKSANEDDQLTLNINQQSGDAHGAMFNA